MTFDEWWDNNISIETQHTFREWEASCRQAWNAAILAERERICADIKAEDDHCADGDYMMDSDDCIKVVRGTWKRPDWNGCNGNSATK